MTSLPLIQRATTYGESVAIVDGDQHVTYDDLVDRSVRFATTLLRGTDDLAEARVGYLVPAGFDYVTTQWAIWLAGGVALPLSLSATHPELEYALTNAEASVVVAAPEQADAIRPLCAQLNILLIVIGDADESVTGPLPHIDPTRRAMMLYTSGTTSQPKGVVTTHANVQAQIEALVEAWRWQSDDRIPLFLPMHHIHGIINVQSCALWSGATVEAFPKFDLNKILDRVAENAYTVFMAVPTIYVRLIQTLEGFDDAQRQPIIDGFANMRLMISGSAALPASVHEQWTSLTGQYLLERYGMTEIGMGLSNPYDGERRPGAVGQPLPGVEVRLKSEQDEVITAEDTSGEIQVRGPAVFQEYWNRPEATAESFDGDWFRTGDVAVLETGYYRILGRQSVDIIKSGGYKLSALEIEAALLDHPDIKECAVVGIEDDAWGESVAAAVVLDDTKRSTASSADAPALTLDSLKTWARDRISHYKIPKQLVVVDTLPRNAMGKITKPVVRELFARLA